MAIELVEIRNTAREIVGIIDLFKSVIWHSVYYGVGDFEVYAQATQEHIRLLKEGYYITVPDKPDIGIIEKIEIFNNPQDGFMVVASGRFAKSILDRRLIYNLVSNTQNKATVLSGNVESAARALVANNCISCTFDTNRNMPMLELGTHSGSTEIIRDENGNAAEKQVSYENLLDYTDKLLEEYQMSARIIVDDDTLKLQYVVYEGTYHTTGTNVIIFSREYDNLLDSNYKHDLSTEKNAALIGGEGEGLERFYTTIIGSQVGISRREMWVDASSLSKKYKDENEQEQTYTDAEYKTMLVTKGKQELATKVATEEFTGTLDITNGIWRINRDFFVGDIVIVQDNQIGKYATVRITETTEVQDENGYAVTINYQ